MNENIDSMDFEDTLEEEDTLYGSEENFGEDEFATGNEGNEGHLNQDIVHVDSMEDILSMDLSGLSPHEVRNFDFASIEVAFDFYNWYSRFNDFAARKSKMIRNKKRDVLQQTFVCHRQGIREDRGLTIENRKRVPKPQIRCGCEAQIRVHIDIHSQRWIVTWFTDQHNHEREWRVSFYPDCDTYKCSCQRMESFGLPCDHILAVLVYLRVAELAKCLIVDRWTKNAKDAIVDFISHRPNFWDSHVASRYGSLMFQYRRLSKLAAESGADFNDFMKDGGYKCFYT